MSWAGCPSGQTRTRNSGRELLGEPSSEHCGVWKRRGSAKRRDGRANGERKSVKAWCDETEPPAKWKGLSTAYRAGAKARAAGKDRIECHYGREDLARAWLSGFDGMDGFLSCGGILLCEQCGQELKRVSQKSWSCQSA